MLFIPWSWDTNDSARTCVVDELLHFILLFLSSPASLIAPESSAVMSLQCHQKEIPQCSETGKLFVFVMTLQWCTLKIYNGPVELKHFFELSFTLARSSHLPLKQIFPTNTNCCTFPGWTHVATTHQVCNRRRDSTTWTQGKFFQAARGERPYAVRFTSLWNHPPPPPALPRQTLQITTPLVSLWSRDSRLFQCWITLLCLGNRCLNLNWLMMHWYWSCVAEELLL